MSEAIQVQLVLPIWPCVYEDHSLENGKAIVGTHSKENDSPSHGTNK